VRSKGSDAAESRYFFQFDNYFFLFIYRLIAAMEFYKQSEVLTPLKDRIRVVAGDLSEERLGLSGEDFHRLATDIDVIYHNGCLVNTRLSYSFLRKPNVLATLGAFRSSTASLCSFIEIIKLAAEHHTKPIVYVSSLSVFAGTTERREVPLVDTSLIGMFLNRCLVRFTDALGMMGGYGASKLASEVLLEKTKAIASIPLTIFRIGMFVNFLGFRNSNSCSRDDFR
jgi:thioester reductase-like protein